MAKIEILRIDNNKKLGEGKGPFDRHAQRAAIDEWVDKAGLQVGTRYALKIDAKSYTGRCETVDGNAAPYATFGDVE